MCLIVFKYQPCDTHKLILLANRDEFYERDTHEAAYWPDLPTIFGGIDGVAGGSWLSVDDNGRMAAITNIRKPPFADSSKKSRGDLIKSFLSSSLSAKQYLGKLKETDHQYNLFNILLFDETGLWHYSNDSGLIEQVSSGVHGLCNASLNTPWPKLINTRRAFEKQINQPSLTTEALLDIMQSETRPDDNELPDTGVGLEFERLLSSAFITSENYGTRCTTLLTIDQKNRVDFKEVTYNSNGQAEKTIHELIKSH